MTVWSCYFGPRSLVTILRGAFFIHNAFALERLTGQTLRWPFFGHQSLGVPGGLECKCVLHGGFPHLHVLKAMTDVPKLGMQTHMTSKFVTTTRFTQAGNKMAPAGLQDIVAHKERKYLVIERVVACLA